MYSLEDTDRFATMITRIATVLFGILFVLALIAILVSL